MIGCEDGDVPLMFRFTLYLDAEGILEDFTTGKIIQGIRISDFS